MIGTVVDNAVRYPSRPAKARAGFPLKLCTAVSEGPDAVFNAWGQPASYAVNQAYHEQFHELLARNLAASDEFNLPAMNAGRNAWLGFFGKYAESQGVAYRILLDTARQFDTANETEFCDYTLRNIQSGNFKPALPGGE